MLSGDPRESKLSEHFNWKDWACVDVKNAKTTQVPLQFAANVQMTANYMEVIRKKCGNVPIEVLRGGGWRTVEFNQESDGRAPYSQHLIGNACDFRCASISPDAMFDIVSGMIASGELPRGYVGKYPTFTHYDHGPASVNDRKQLVASTLGRVENV